VESNEDRQCSRLKASMPFKRDLALQNIYTSLKTTLLQLKMKTDITGRVQHNMLCPAQEPPTSVGHCHYKKRNGVRWLILDDSSHYTGNMYHIIHAQV
jgi:hypothetical protein